MINITIYIYTAIQLIMESYMLLSNLVAAVNDMQYVTILLRRMQRSCH